MNAAWTAEWWVALRRRRLLVLNVSVPLLLVAPLVVASPPAVHAGAVYTVLFVLFGVFGSAIPLARDGDAGLLGRWLLAGMPPRRLLAGRVLAQTLLDLMQLLPALLLVWASGHEPSPAALPSLVAVLGAGLLVANALGVWTAALARSLAETALFSAVAALLTLHASGVFRTPDPGSWGGWIERAAPFRPLHEALLASAGGPSPSPSSWGVPLQVGLGLALLTWGLAAPLLESLRKGDDS